MHKVDIMEPDSTTEDIDECFKQMDSLNKINNGQKELTFSEVTFYKEVLRPFLKPGNEYKLLHWLKEHNLLHTNMSCSNQEIGCQLEWQNSRDTDKFMWKCRNCGVHKSIRSNSFFEDVNCSIQTVMNTILAWCEDMDTSTVSSKLGVSNKVITSVYNKIENLVSLHSLTQKLGGPDSVVLLELFPDGVVEHQPDSSKCDTRRSHKIFCIADTKKIPTRYWLHIITGNILETNENNNLFLKKTTLEEEILHVMKYAVEPGSLVVIGSAQQLRPLAGSLPYHDNYQAVTSIDTLTANHSCNANMHTFITETIWRQAVTLCTASQDLPKCQIQAYLRCALFKTMRSASDVFSDLVQLIADTYASNSNDVTC